MSEGIDAGDVRRWIEALLNILTAEQDVLDSLDAGAGDGDHGATMILGLRRVMTGLYPADTTPSQVLKTMGRRFAGVGGSIGPLWGLAFLRASQALPDTPAVTGRQIAEALLSAASAIAEMGSATVGDRTLLDAAYPAAEAFAATLEQTGDPARAATAGCQAALAGAAASAHMTAARGRAARNPALAAGRVDPGAASLALAWTVAVHPGDLSAWHQVVADSVTQDRGQLQHTSGDEGN
jgi:dihydroxyacetone kinase-like protein